MYLVSLNTSYLGESNLASSFVINLEGYAVEMCLAVIFYGVNFCKASQMNFFRALTELEQEIRTVEKHRQSFVRRMRKRSLLFMAVNVTFNIVMLSFFVSTVEREIFLQNFSTSVSYTTVYMLLSFITFFLENLAMMIGSLFDQLGDKAALVPRRSSKFCLNELRKIFDLHDSLVRLIETFNDSFGVIILGVFLYLLMSFTMEFYFFFSIFLNPQSSELMDIIKGALNVFFFTLLWISFFKLGITCEGVRSKVTTNVIEHEVITTCLMSLQAMQISVHLESIQPGLCLTCAREKVRRLWFR
jgi:7tm Chemosensory receptor